MPIEEYIRNKISDILNKTGWSASELGRRSGYGRSYIGNILAGNFLPTFYALESICHCSKMTISEFFMHYEPNKNDLVTEVKRLFTAQEEQMIYELLRRLDPESVRLFLNWIEHVHKKALEAPE